jgi:hypothetical protein
MVCSEIPRFAASAPSVRLSNTPRVIFSSRLGSLKKRATATHAASLGNPAPNGVNRTTVARPAAGSTLKTFPFFLICLRNLANAVNYPASQSRVHTQFLVFPRSKSPE